MNALRVGILGAAGIAPAAMVAPASRRSDVTIVAIASRRLEAAVEFATRHDIPSAHAGYDALLADPTVDAVYLALPPSEHATWSIRALEAGKHVLCEKPAAMDATEAAAMVEAAARTGRLLLEAFHDGYHPAMRRVIDMVATGELGALTAVDGTLVAPIPFGTSSIRHDPALGGGALMDLGCYPVHWLRTVVGEEPDVVTAAAVLNRSGADESIEATLAFPSGFDGRIVASMGVEQFACTLVIRGTRATVTLTNPLHPHRGHSVHVEPVDGPDRTFTVAGDETYDYQLAAFVQAVREGIPSPEAGRDIVANMQVIDAIYERAGVHRT